MAPWGIAGKIERAVNRGQWTVDRGQWTGAVNSGQWTVNSKKKATMYNLQDRVAIITGDGMGHWRGGGPETGGMRRPCRFGRYLCPRV
ncbi:MAG: hypothetical protein M5U34_46620 [Chloroflexi bacterium]|nr:hypothetical protein [Chloroflexota bacterium]